MEGLGEKPLNFSALSAEAHEDIFTYLGRNTGFVPDNLVYQVICLLINACGRVVDNVATGVVTGSGNTVAVNVYVTVLQVQLERINGVLRINLVVKPLLVISERNRPQTAYLHNLLNGAAILLFGVIEVFHSEKVY
jgi:hypothetical protein